MSSKSLISREGYLPPRHQARVDTIQRLMRAEPPRNRPNIFRPAPPRPPRSKEEIDHRIAEELEFVVRNIEQLGGILVNDPILLHRHGASLQALDLVSQNLRNLAEVVSAENKQAAVDRISLPELRRRLSRGRTSTAAE